MARTFRLYPSHVALTGLIWASLLAAGSAQNAVKLDVPYVPTPPEVVERMLQLTDVGKDDYVIDLGSGDGRIAIAAAKRGATAFGVDIDPDRIAEARANAKKAGVEARVSFEQRNLFQTDISKATVLTMYLLQTVNRQLRPRVLDELRPGTRVVSHAFDMGEWEPDQRDTVNGRNVYMWWVPAKVEGRWNVEAGERKIALDLKQQFQVLTGKATINGREVALKAGRLRGTDIELVLDTEGGPITLKGRVEGDAMQGSNWRASRA